MQNLNQVALTGCLTRDIESRGEVHKIRLAINGRKQNAQKEWEDTAGYYDVLVFGPQGENCKKFLSKGDPVAVSGRLDWQEWVTSEGTKRERVCVVASFVQFLRPSKEPISQSVLDATTAPEDIVF